MCYVIFQKVSKRTKRAVRTDCTGMRAVYSPIDTADTLEEARKICSGKIDLHFELSNKAIETEGLSYSR